MNETKIFERPKSLVDVVTHYCPGCTHGVAHRLVAEIIDELGIQERTVAVAPGTGGFVRPPASRPVEVAA